MLTQDPAELRQTATSLESIARRYREAAAAQESVSRAELVERDRRRLALAFQVRKFREEEGTADELPPVATFDYHKVGGPNLARALEVQAYDDALVGGRDIMRDGYRSFRLDRIVPGSVELVLG